MQALVPDLLDGLKHGANLGNNQVSEIAPPIGDTHMVPSLHDLGIDRLNTEERLELISAIWDSLPPLPEIPESHKRELERRMALSDADPGRNLPWREVLDRLQSQS